MVFLIVVLFQGLIHLLGLIKGIGHKEVMDLIPPVSNAIGVVWLSATVLFRRHGVLHLLNLKYAWLIGLVAVLFSQVLVIIFCATVHKFSSQC